MSKTRTAPARPAAKVRPPAERAKVRDVLDQRLDSWQRGVLAGVVVLAAVAIWRPLTDPFMLPKLSAVLLGAVVLAVLAGVRAVRAARAGLPSGPAVWLLLALLAVMAVTTATAQNPALSLVGQRSRYGGLLSYLGFAVVFLVAVRVYRHGQTRGLVRTLLVCLGLVSAYGLVQAAGLDPYTWDSRGLVQTFSTMGNINFASGYTASLIPVAAAVALLPGWPLASRWVAGSLVLLGGAYLVFAQSAQGPLAAAGGLAVVGAAWLLSRQRQSTGSPQGRRRALLLALGAALTAVVLLGAVASRLGAEVAAGLSERRYFWGAALGVLGDHPLLGTGLESFRDYFTIYRAPEHAVALGFDGADSVHSVPLGMFVAGGILLGLLYLAFVGYTGWVLVRGLRSGPAAQLPVLAAFGGMWAAYQVQSLVSLDVVPVTFLHFVSAGVIHALAGAFRSRGLPLPWRPAARGAFLARQGRDRQLGAAVMVALLLLGVVSAWWLSRPLRADLHAAAARGTQDQAERGELLDRAVELAPWEAEYRILQGQGRLDAGGVDAANPSVLAAAELRRGSSRLALGAADFAQRQGDPELQLRWIEEALRRDPVNPQLLDEAAELFRARGDAARADELTQRAASLRENHSDY